MKREIVGEYFFEEVDEVEKQIVTFPVIAKEGIVTKIGKSYITHPEIRFNGNGIKWYENKMKNKTN